jgi:hypothetical protein
MAWDLNVKLVFWETVEEEGSETVIEDGFEFCYRCFAVGILAGFGGLRGGFVGDGRVEDLGDVVFG